MREIIKFIMLLDKSIAVSIDGHPVCAGCSISYIFEVKTGCSGTLFPDGETADPCHHDTLSIVGRKWFSNG